VVVGGTTLLPIFILVVFPTMIDLFGKQAVRRGRAAEQSLAGNRPDRRPAS
jgi:hypothetical protein